VYIYLLSLLVDIFGVWGRFGVSVFESSFDTYFQSDFGPTTLPFPASVSSFVSWREKDLSPGVERGLVKVG
jgi:hypothetical protein